MRTLLMTVLMAGCSLAARTAPPAVDAVLRKATAFLEAQPDSAFVYAQQALLLASQPAYPHGLAEAHELLGRIFYQQAVFKSAMEHLFLAQEFHRQTGDKTGLAETHNLLGLAYYYGLEINLARTNHLAALQYYEEVGNSEGKAETLGHLGHLAEKEKNYEQALQYQQAALALYEQLGNAAGMGKILENIGSIQEDFGSYVLAREYFTRALTYSQQAGKMATVINILNNIGDTYRKENRLREALGYSRQARDLAQTHNQQYLLRAALKDLSKAYALMGDFRQAHACLDSSYTLYETIYDDESAKQLAQMQTVYETERKNRAILLLEREQRIFQLGAGLVVVALLTGVVIFLILMRNQRARQRIAAAQLEQERLLLTTQLENTRLSEQTLSAALENKQLREQQLHAELEQRAKELTTSALQVVQKNRFLEEMREQLIEIKKSDKEKDRSKLLRELIHSIDRSFKQDQDWDEFRRTFEQVHQDFFHTLQTTYPDLSSNDLRICALLKLNLSSPDIATLLGISQDSFRTARYRLRKKMGIEERASLRALIMSL